MDQTFAKYVEFLQKNRSEIRSSMLIEHESSVYRYMKDAFSQHFVSYSGGSEYTKSVAAVDSSEFERELYNGKKIMLARAFCISGERTYSDFFSEVAWVSRDDLRTLLTMLMEHCEHTSVLELLKHEAPEIIFVDGSLTGRLMHRRSRFNAEKMTNFAESYFEQLNRMLDLAIEKGSNLVFLSKSSESRSLLTSILDKMAPVPDDLRSQIQGLVDHVLIKSLAGTPGYTTPIEFKSASPANKEKILTFHVLPAMNDLPMKVDFLSHFDSPVQRKKMLDTIFWGYTGLKVHNLWISKVDTMVKFRSEIMERLYMRYFQEQIGIDFYETRGERRARVRI